MLQSDFESELKGFIDFEDNDLDDILNDLPDQPVEEFNIKPNRQPVIHNHEIITSLKSDERNLIESCSDIDLRNLLSLNRAKRMQLIQLYKYIKDMLAECQENIRSKELYISQMKKTFSSNYFVNRVRLSAPYFKDTNLFPSPLTADALKKQEEGDLSIYNRGAPSKWTSNECECLVKAVKLNYNMNKQKQKQKDIVKLKRQLRLAEPYSEERATVQDKIDAVTEELRLLKQNSKDGVPQLKDNTFVDWHRISLYFLKSKHSPQECEAFWNIYLHPSINKNNWTEEENVQITNLAAEHNYQNWDRIADLLQTGRTGFLTCVHYSSVLSKKYKNDKFTPDEDKQLISVVEKCRLGGAIKWGIIAQHFEDRSKEQLFNRYTYYLLPMQEKGSQIDRSKFTEAEDVLLMLLVERFGKNFVKCAEHFTNRTYMQLKSRYNSNLQIHIRKGTWNIEDDRNILKHVEKSGTRSWGSLAKALNRSRGQLRQRYLFLEKFFTKYPGSDLSKVPKRKHSLFGNTKNQHTFMKFIADKFKNVGKIPTLAAIQNCLETQKILSSRANKKRGPKQKKPPVCSSASSELKDIDALLIDFFATRPKSQAPAKRDLLNFDEAFKDTKVVLNYLEVDLDYPKWITEDLSLDETDLRILTQLMKTYKRTKSLLSFKIPANVDTFKGFRHLLLNCKSSETEESTVAPDMPLSRVKLEPLSESTPSASTNSINFQDNTIGDPTPDMNALFRRFQSLFFWPSVFNLETPQGSAEEDMSIIIVEQEDVSPQPMDVDQKVFVKFQNVKYL